MKTVMWQFFLLTPQHFCSFLSQTISKINSLRFSNEQFTTIFIQRYFWTVRSGFVIGVFGTESYSQYSVLGNNLQPLTTFPISVMNYCGTNVYKLPFSTKKLSCYCTRFTGNNPCLVLIHSQLILWLFQQFILIISNTEFLMESTPWRFRTGRQVLTS